jgi:hypothetical protein
MSILMEQEKALDELRSKIRGYEEKEGMGWDGKALLKFKIVTDDLRSANPQTSVAKL